VDVFAIGERFQFAVGGIGVVLVREAGSQFVHEARPAVLGLSSVHAVLPILVPLLRLLLQLAGDPKDATPFAAYDFLGLALQELLHLHPPSPEGHTSVGAQKLRRWLDL
jgi:hypothetical protein